MHFLVPQDKFSLARQQATAFKSQIQNLFFFPEYSYLKKRYLLLAGRKSNSLHFPRATCVH